MEPCSVIDPKTKQYTHKSFGHQGEGLGEVTHGLVRCLGMESAATKSGSEFCLGTHSTRRDSCKVSSDLSCALWYVSVCTHEHKYINCPVISFMPDRSSTRSELRSHEDLLSAELTFGQACLYLTIALLGKYFNQHLNSCLTNVPIFTILLYNLIPLGNSLYKVSDSPLRQEYVCVQAGSQ